MSFDGRGAGARHSVCAVTGTRAEFGLLRPLLARLREESAVELRLIVTGSHLSQAFGQTACEIEEAGFSGYEKIPVLSGGDSQADMAQATGKALSAFAVSFSRLRPELLVILGDRYEIFAAAAAAAMLGIPIAHLCGGETTEGAVDEFLRHSITKMSTLHFTGCEEYRRRVIQLGEAPDRVFNVGEPGVENAANLAVLTPEDLRADLGFPRPDRPYAVVTFHPVTLERETGESQLRQLIQAMDVFPQLDYIVTLANADAGGRAINRIWEEEGARRRNWLVVPSLGAKRYVSALRSAAFVLGNSSSGITEAPSFHIPTVNIGDRQRGRVMAGSVLCCPPDAAAIESAIRRAMTEEFRAVAARESSPFGDGHTSEKILPVLLGFLESSDKSLKKPFYDLSFEV